MRAYCGNFHQLISRMMWDVCYQKIWKASDEGPWPTPIWKIYKSQNNDSFCWVLNRIFSGFKSETLSLEAACSVDFYICLSRYFCCYGIGRFLNVTMTTGQYVAFMLPSMHVNFSIISLCLQSFQPTLRFYLAFHSFICFCSPNNKY
jgi:hypothetical protein